MLVRPCFRFEVGLSQGLSRSHSRLEQIVRFPRLTHSPNFETCFKTPASYNKANSDFEHILAQNVVKSRYSCLSERLCMVNGLVPNSVFFVCLFVCLFFLRRYHKRSTKTFPLGLFVCFQLRNFPSEVC